MSNQKYLNICAGALGVTAAIIGSTIILSRISNKSSIAGAFLFVGGSLVVVASLSQAQIESGIDNILEEKRESVPKTCRGCKNFHGIKYGGVMLVCGMHPSGVEGNTCSDFEKFSQKGVTKWK